MSVLSSGISEASMLASALFVLSFPGVKIPSASQVERQGSEFWPCYLDLYGLGQFSVPQFPHLLNGVYVAHLASCFAV